MIRDVSPIIQTCLGTLFTWGLTAVGASLVFVFHSGQRRLLDGSLGFAAGVMTAASYWSLLEPAIQLARSSTLYGDNGQWAFFPVVAGFILGAFFVFSSDIILSHVAPGYGGDGPCHGQVDCLLHTSSNGQANDYMNGLFSHDRHDYGIKRRLSPQVSALQENSESACSLTQESSHHPHLDRHISWRRISLLIFAITIHNIPEGLAVGVSFGAISQNKMATFESARNLAIGIGIQNFPEGLAVSLPLRASGFSVATSFWYGQLSGLVEPIAGLVGTVAVTAAQPLLPYALAFAAGAMIYVVFDDIIPEAHIGGNGRLASWAAMLGFSVMMTLDVGLA